ncbi:MAG: fatty acid desaturase [Myxococcales bacterium]|nr:fatty acid desaturase [Myxococcales bacterium]
MSAIFTEPTSLHLRKETDTSTSPTPSKAREKAPRVDLSRPSVAWPTLFLFAGCFVAWFGLGALYLKGWLAWPLVTFLCGMAAFAAFTPMHDSSHKSVGGSKFLNEAVGRLSGIFLLAPFPAFRWIHLEHHKHTNDPHKDPDYWTSRKPFLFLRWLSLDLHYYTLYIKAGSARPLGERIETWASFIVLWGAAITLFVLYPWETTVLLLIPSRIAVCCLALFFDYLPHVPHHTTSSEDRYRATNVVKGPTYLLTPLLLYQNYHLIHHLYPGVPFYRYADIWFTQRDFLRKQGVQEVSILGKNMGDSGQVRAGDHGGSPQI